MAAELHANRDLSMDKKVVSDVSVADVFGALADESIVVDMIVQGRSAADAADDPAKATD